MRNRYNQVPHLTQETTRENDKNTTKHTREPIFLKILILKKKTAEDQNFRKFPSMQIVKNENALIN